MAVRLMRLAPAAVGRHPAAAAWSHLAAESASAFLSFSTTAASAATVSVETPSGDPKAWGADDVQRWFAAHEDGIWAEYAHRFARLNGEEMSALSEEAFAAIAEHPLGRAIYNDWRALVGAAGAERATEMWRALHHLPVEVVDVNWDRDEVPEQRAHALLRCAAGDVEVLSLPLGVSWPTEPAEPHLFVRPCFKEMYTLVEEMFVRPRVAELQQHGVIVSGNPGVGKSWFLSYVMFRVAREHPGRDVVFESVTHNLILVCRANGRVSVIEGDWQKRATLPELKTPSTVYLFDPSGNDENATREPHACAAFTVVAASPNKSHYQQFFKRTFVEGKRFLEVWSGEELRAVRPFVQTTTPELTAEELERRLYRFGGIVRAVFATDAAKWEAEQESAFDSGRLDAVRHAVSHVDDKGDKSTHQLVAYDVVGNAKPPRSRVRGRFVSQYVKAEFPARYVREKKAEAAAFLAAAQTKAELAEISGALFEHWAHDSLRRGGKFRVRRLNGGAADGGDPDPEHLVLPPLHHVDVARVADLRGALADSRGDCYFAPTMRNFPALDAVVRASTPFSAAIGLQMTVAREHPLKAARVEDILRQLAVTKADRFDLFFVVWPATFDDFCEQQFTSVDGEKRKRPSALLSSAVRQWVLEVPLVVPT